MKKIYPLAVALLMTGAAQAQWQPNMRLTNSIGNANTHANSNRCLAVNGNEVHAVWQDARNGNLDIFYKRSLNGGLTWEADVALITNSEFQATPAIAVSGSNVHIVWEDDRDGGSEVYYARSTDAGATWSTEVKISNEGFNIGTPSIAVEGNNVHVVWMETSSMFVEDVYHISSTDGGLTWGDEHKLSGQDSDEEQPTVAVSGNNIHVAWADNRFYSGADWNREIYYIRSTDGGATWGTEVRVSNNDEESEFPAIAATGVNVHIAWQDDRTGVMQVFTRSSTDNGSTWGLEAQVTNDAIVPAQLPSIAANGSDVHLAWVSLNMTNISNDIYYAKSTNAGAVFGAREDVTNHEGSSTNPHVAVSGTRVHVLWQDDREVAGEPYDIEVYYTNNENTSSVESIGASSFIVFPVPANNKLIVSGDVTTNETYDVIDNLGRVVLQGKLSANEIDVTTLTDGFYMIRIGSATKPFAIQHK